jgi:2-polyprenyl-3-methyl-5-hydroxy-6-metoxy-1,4-benzoquinol methylase
VRHDCLACGRAGRFWTKKAGRNVWRCDACGLVWVPEGLVVDERGASIYEGDEPIFLQDGNEQYYLDETNLMSCREKLAWVREHAPAGASLVDVGANFGHFLSVAREDYRARGVEISSAAVEWSKKHFGVENAVGSIYDLPPALRGPYDVVTLWDVIEHVPDPREALTALHRIVRTEGLLFLSTPDAGSRVARLMRSRWHYLDPVQHLVLFGRENLARILRDSGFEVVSTRTFGHHYRVGYVLDRLAYLHDEGALGRVTGIAKTAFRPAAKLSVYLNLRDVMGIVARAT